MRKIGAIVRVSTDEQALREEGSIKNQLIACRRYVDEQNALHGGRWGVIVDEYVDDGFSGKSLDRPAMKRALADLNSGKIDTLVFTALDRVLRNKTGWYRLLEYYKDRGVQFISTRQKIDLSSAIGRAMFGLVLEFGQFEREQTVERVVHSIRERKRRGLYNGGPIPFGLEATEKKGHLLVNPTKQAIANSIIDVLLNESGCLKSTCKIINGRGWFRDCGPWNFQALAHWIRNPHVAGQVEINAKNKNKDLSQLAETEKYQLLDAMWEPVIEREKLEAARKLLDENYRKLKVSTWQDHEYLLTNLIVCHQGNPLTGGSGRGRSGQKYAYYKHPHRIKCSCGIGRVPAAKIEQHIFRELKRLLKAPKLVAQLCDEANKKALSTQPNYDEMIRSEKKRIDSVTNQLDKITDEILTANSPQEKQMWRDKAFRLQSDRSNIEKQIIHFENLKRNKPEPVSHSAILNALSKLSDGFKGMPVAARLRLIKGVIAGIRINKDYTLTMQVKNPDLLDFKGSEESVITGAIGSPTYKNGSGGGTRTPDQAVNSRLLYRLSYS